MRLPQIIWENSLKPQLSKTKVQQWDEWFEATGDEESLKSWNTTKSVFLNEPDPAVLDRWATIIELNRLDRIQKAKADASISTDDCTEH